MQETSKYITFGDKTNSFESEARDKEFAESINDRPGFWKKQAEAVSWHKFPTQILDESHKYLKRWYVDGEINICYNAIDRHVEAGRGDVCALIYDSVYTGQKTKYSYNELQ